MDLASRLVREFNGRPIIVYNDVSIAAALIERSPAVAVALASKRANGELPDDLRPVVKKLISGEATIDDVEPSAPEAAARLRAIAAALDPEEFVLHLDDFDEAVGYYTGIRFRIYGKALLARGGRYDNLYSTFGRPAAAIGFTFTIDDLERAVDAHRHSERAVAAAGPAPVCGGAIRRTVGRGSAVAQARLRPPRRGVDSGQGLGRAGVRPARRRRRRRGRPRPDPRARLHEIGRA